MPSQVGRITVVQEGRFQLLGEDGRSTLYILARDAAIEPQDLPRLQRRQARVAVEGEAAPGLIASVARRIRVLGPVSHLERTPR